MATSDRGILYIVWGEKAEKPLERSIESVKRIHPALPLHVVRATPDPTRGLQVKSTMAALTPFSTTLYLDADTVVLGNLDYAFDRAEEFGLACSICECPWLRRYGQSEGDGIEYNTGVLFFTEKARPVFDAWQALAPTTPATSRWMTMENKPKGLKYDDQASFAKAVRSSGFNPFTLPFNYNFRPGFHRSFFAPLKIWHDYRDVPPSVVQYSIACETGRRPVTYLEIVQENDDQTPGATPGKFQPP